MGTPVFAYVQSRLQARHGERPDEAMWRGLRAIKDAGGYLERARATGLRQWVEPFGRDTGVHTMERELRHAYGHYVAEVAGWLPHRWRSAVGWMDQLPTLPLLDHLLRGGTPQPWMHDDPALATSTNTGPRHRSDSSPATDSHWEEATGQGLMEAWLARWRARWPDIDPGLQRLARLLTDTRRTLTQPELPDSSAAAARLEHGLRRVFRMHARQPASACAHLGLVAIDIARVRGDLANRLLFEGTPR